MTPHTQIRKRRSVGKRLFLFEKNHSWFIVGGVGQPGCHGHWQGLTGVEGWTACVVGRRAFPGSSGWALPGAQVGLCFDGYFCGCKCFLYIFKAF